ncbi:MAG TPA: SDR family oxidoreductase, partial [Thermomicrobiales bacterium]|nr:SDR family oxidoreductase [Thermomicrobiales bacterium]
VLRHLDGDVTACPEGESALWLPWTWHEGGDRTRDRVGRLGLRELPLGPRHGGVRAGVDPRCKHGGVGLNRTAALEYLRRGIRVNAFCPGLIHVPMIDGGSVEAQGTLRQLDEIEPMGRRGSAGLIVLRRRAGAAGG